MTIITRNLWLVFATFTLSALILYLVIMHLDPFGEQALQAYVLLFFSAFFMTASFSIMFLFFGSELIFGRKLGKRKFFRAVRRGILIAIFIIICLILQLFKLLGILEIALLAMFLLIFEYILYFAYRW
jgi:hypothetical protein